MWMWMVIALNVVTNVHGYASRLFPQACDSMLPVHLRKDVPYEPQKGEPPFETDYELGKEGEPITVSLRSKTSVPFIGFMLEAREQGRTDEGLPVGRFILLDTLNTQLLECAGSPGSALIQKNNHDKSEIKANWTAEGAKLEITFRTTFLQAFGIFWNPVDKNVTKTPPTTTTTTTTTSTTTTSTTTTTTSTSEPSSTSGTAKPVTTASTTNPSTTASTSKSSSTSGTAKPVTTASTTNPSTTASTSKSSSTSGTAKPVTTASTTNPSTTASTSKSSSTSGTAKPVTTASTTNPSTTTSTSKSSSTSGAAKPVTTASTTNPSTTASTSEPESDLQPSKDMIAAAMTTMTFDSLGVVLGMELCNILSTITSLHPGLNKGIKITCAVFCAAAEISALVLCCVADFNKAVLVPLVVTTMVINFIELIIASLPLGSKLQSKADVAAKVCSVIHELFTIAVMFVAVWETDHCRKNENESWLVTVMAVYTAWIFLFMIWVFMLHQTKLWRKVNFTVNPEKKSERKKKPCTADKAFSVILIVGTIAFNIAIIYGIFGCRKK